MNKQSDPPAQSEFIGAVEAARILECSRTSVHNYSLAGELAYEDVPRRGRMWRRYKRSDVEALARKRRGEEGVV